MVTRKTAVAAKTYPSTHQDSDGAWLCNTVANCDKPAVQQAAVACAGCDDIRAQTTAGIDRKRAEIAQHNEIERQVLEAATSEDRNLSDLEQLHLQVVAMKRQDLGVDLEQLEAAAAVIDADHTHPVFACAQHVGRLPK